MHQAIRPDFFTEIKKMVAKKPEKDPEILKEQALASLSDTDGWKVLNEYIQSVITGLDELNEQKLASGASFEDIGQNAVVIQLAKGLLKKVTQKVQDARDAREGEPRGK